MQWILQDFEDTRQLAGVLDAWGLSWSLHRIVPFEGSLIPEPDIADPDAVVLFGAYTMRHYARSRGLRPGVFVLRPFVHEAAWAPYLLNGPGSRFMTLAELPHRIAADDEPWFMRPVEDSKEEPGRVRSGAELHDLARKVMALDPEEIPRGALRHDTDLMLSEPRQIAAEWRIWVVSDQVVTWSLYRRGRRVIYEPQIDADALDFARRMVAANPGYAQAYVMDICRAEDRLWLLETNCLNAAGFYAADIPRLVDAIERLGAA